MGGADAGSFTFDRRHPPDHHQIRHRLRLRGRMSSYTVTVTADDEQRRHRGDDRDDHADGRRRAAGRPGRAEGDGGLRLDHEPERELDGPGQRGQAGHRELRPPVPGGQTAAAFTAGPQNVTGTSTTITGLAMDTEYEVQVRATNDEGDGPWSASGSAAAPRPTPLRRSAARRRPAPSPRTRRRTRTSARSFRRRRTPTATP